MSKVKSQPVVTPQDTYDLTVSYIAQGKNQKDCIRSLGISKPTYYDHLTKMGTDWKSLKSQYTSNPTLPPSHSLKIREGEPGNDPSRSHSYQPIPTSSAPDDRRPPPLAGGLKKLTEEVLENAIVEVLQTDPAKGLSTALAFLDKKKSISIEDQDTNLSRISLEKLHRNRERLFS